jgi:hypothetical protein
VTANLELRLAVYERVSRWRDNPLPVIPAEQALLERRVTPGNPLVHACDEKNSTESVNPLKIHM